MDVAMNQERAVFTPVDFCYPLLKFQIPEGPQIFRGKVAEENLFPLTANNSSEFNYLIKVKLKVFKVPVVIPLYEDFSAGELPPSL